MNKLISALIATVFASTLSFNAIAAKHMSAAPADAPAPATAKDKEMKHEMKKRNEDGKERRKEN